MKLSGDQKPAGRQQGIAIGVVIATLMLLALLAASLAIASHDTTSYVSREQYKTMLMTQAQMIRQKIARCALDYPAGSNGSANAADVAYPLADTLAAASGLTCPGSGGQIFDGTDGAFYPAVISGCNGWQYINNKTASPAYVNLQIKCTANQAIAALGDLYARFGSGEAQQATGTVTNDTLIVLLHK